MSQSEPHDEFLELCAVSASGQQLTQEEQKKLKEHLTVCPGALHNSQKVFDLTGAGQFPPLPTVLHPLF